MDVSTTFVTKHVLAVCDTSQIHTAGVYKASNLTHLRLLYIAVQYLVRQHACNHAPTLLSNRCIGKYER